MYKGFIATLKGPCTVSKDVFSKIVQKKMDDAYFGSQVILALEVSLEKNVTFTVSSGDLPHVLTMSDFEDRFISVPRRSIITDDS